MTLSEMLFAFEKKFTIERQRGGGIQIPTQYRDVTNNMFGQAFEIPKMLI